MSELKIRRRDKILSVFLAVLMIIGVFPISAFAENSDGKKTSLTTDIAGKSFTVGQSEEFTFTTNASADDEGKYVVGTFDFLNDNGAKYKLEYLENDGNWYPLDGDFGPAGGFPLTDGAVSKFRVTFENADTYKFTASIKEVSTGKILCSAEEISVTASEKQTERASLTTNITDLKFVQGRYTEFKFKTTANSDKGVMVIGSSNFNDPDAIESLEYYETKTGVWMTLDGEFGPSEGFPMSDAESLFRVKFKTPGNYSFTASMKYASGENKGSVLCSVDSAFHVYASDAVSITKNDGGTVTVGEVSLSGNESSKSFNVIEGDKINVSAVPDAGWQISSVSINGIQQNLNGNFETFRTEITAKDEDISIDVKFVKLYTIIVSYDSESGTIEATPECKGGTIYAVSGDKVTVKATPKSEYRVSEVKIDDKTTKYDTNEFDSSRPYEWTGIANKDYTVEITFAPLVYKIECNIPSNASVSLSGSRVNIHENATLEITCKPNYKISKVLVNDIDMTAFLAESDGSAVVLVISDIKENKKIEITIAESESVFADGNIVWNYGDAVRHDGSVYVFKKGESVRFSTVKQGIRIICEDGSVLGGYNTQIADIDSTKKIDKIELRYDFGWHTVTSSDFAVFAPVIAIDNGKPVAAVNTDDSCKDVNGFYTTDVKLVAAAEDAGEYYSGIERIEYKIKTDDKESEWISLYEFNNTADELAKKVGDLDITVNSSEYNGSNVTVFVRAYDIAGNVSDESSVVLNILTAKPSVVIEYNENDVSPYAAEGTVWYNVKRTAVVKITDRADAFNRLSAESGFKFEDSSVKDVSFSEWTHNGDVHTAVVTFVSQGEYKIAAYEYVNSASLSAESVSFKGSNTKYFGIDETLPFGELVSSNSSWGVWSKLLDSITFGLFTNSEISFSLKGNKGEDINSGFQKVSYYISESDNVLAESELNSLYDSGKFTDDGTDGVYGVTVNNESKFAVYARIADNAGNVAYIGSQGVIYDVTASNISLNLKASSAGTGVYGVGDLETFNVEGKEIKGIKTGVCVTDELSGIKLVTYEIKADSKESESGTLFAAKNGRIVKEIKDLSVIIDAEKFNSTNVVVSVTAEDNAGNKFTRNITIAEINTDPITAEVNIDGVPVTVGESGHGWYSTGRKATLTVNDSAFDADAAFSAIKIKRNSLPLTESEINSGDIVKFGTWTDGETVNSHIISLEFISDGIYEWSFDYKNKAGNKFDFKSIGKDDEKTPFDFTIDSVKPTGEIKENGFSWGSILNKITFGVFNNKPEFSVTASVDDDLSPVKVTYYKSSADKVLSGEELNALYGSGKFTDAVPSAVEKDEFVVYARFTDNAGNYSYYCSDGHIVENSGAAVSIVSVDPASGIYSLADLKDITVTENGESKTVKGIDVSVNAKEANDGDDIYSGIKSITYEVKKSFTENDAGSVTQSGTLYSYSTPEGGSEKSDLCREYNTNVVIDAEKNDACFVTLTVTVTDNAGNVSTGVKKFDIDVSQPEIEVSYDINAPQNGSYFSDSRTATVVITERGSHFNKESAAEFLRESITASKLSGELSEEETQKLYSISWDDDVFSNSNPNEDKFTAKVVFDGSAAYSFAPTYTDAAGNLNKEIVYADGTAAPSSFTVDKTKPTGSVSINENTWTDFADTLTFGLFSNKKTLVSASGEDDISPVTVEYYKHSSDVPLKEVDISALSFISYEPFEISNDDMFSVYVKITDSAGNFTVINSDGYIVDTAKSNGVIVKAVDQPNENGIYGIDNVKKYGDVTGVKVHIDAMGENLYKSGIASVSYVVSSDIDGEIVTTQEGTLYSFKHVRNDENRGGSIDIKDVNEKDIHKDGAVPQISDLRTSWSGDIIVDASKNNSCNVNVTVTVTDNAGNVYTNTEKYPINLDIDTNSPLVDITFDNNAVIGEKYFNAPRTATIVVTDRDSHFDPAAASAGIVITAKDAKGRNVENAYDISGWTDEKHGANPDKTTHTALISFKSDANYTFEFSYAGKSKNVNSKINTGACAVPFDFVVDTTAPVSSVSVNNHVWSKLLSVLTFGLYDNVKADVTVETSDATTYSVVEYYKTNDPVALDTKALDELYAQNKFAAYEKFSVKANEQFVVYVRSVDAAGNYSYISTDGYIVDNVGASITLTPDKTNENGIYGLNNVSDYNFNGKTINGIKVAVNAKEAEPYSGISKVEYWVTSDGKETQRQTLFSFDYSRETGENTNNGTLKIVDYSDMSEKVTTFSGNVPTKDQLVSEWNGALIVDSSLNNSSNVKVYVGVTDNAGNYTQENISIDVDVTSPEIKVVYGSVSNSNAQNGYYTSRTAVISITERSNHFDSSAASDGISITAFDSKGNAVDSAYSLSAWTTAEGESADAAVHTATLKYAADANYTFNISYSDKAGNTNTTVDYSDAENVNKFTVDSTAPEGTVTAVSAEGRTESWSSVVDSLTFGFWSNSKISVSSSADDATSPIASVEFYMNSSVNANDNTEVLSKEELDKIETWQTFNPFDITENKQFTVYLKITDCAGNYTYVSTNGLIVDDEHPIEESVAPEITVSPVQPVNGIYNGDVKVSVRVVDPIVGGTYSGLKNVSYKIFDRDSDKPDVPTQEGNLFTFNTENPKQSDLRQIFEGEITVEASKNNSNNIQVVVYATDNSLNSVDNSQKESKGYTVVKIDTTAPAIDISYDNNNADSGYYFKSDRTASVTITERNFDPNGVRILITNSDGTIPSVIGWKNTEGTGNKDNAKHTATITYSADGDYRFVISYTDLAGNNAGKAKFAQGTVAPDSFTIDKTSPKVSVSYDNNSAANEKYFNAKRTATVTVVEHNFSENRVDFKQTASVSSNEISVPSAVWTNHSGDVHTAVISYNADGDYTFDVSVKDLAGNESPEADYGNSVAAKSFTVDTKIDNPVIGGVDDSKAYNDAVIPTVSFSDVNFDNYDIKLTRTRFGDKNADVTAQFLKGLSRSASGISGAFDTFEKVSENDGIYTLTLSVTDLAGNKSSASKTFTVNRFGSVYEYDDYLISLIKDGGCFVTKKDGADSAITKDLVITEYNASRIASGSLMILITRNGEPIDVKYTSDPDASDNVSIDGSGWFRYVYTISKDNFTQDGVYRITISSKDDNNNSSTSVPENSIDVNGNSVKDSIMFTVDTTKPEIRNVSFDPQVKFHDDYASVNAQSVSVNYSIVDVGGLAYVEVFINGESQGKITEFTDSVNSYENSFVVNESGDRQSIRITAVDFAGNVTDTSSEDFNPGDSYEFRGNLLVSTNGFIRWYEDKAMFFGSIGAAVGVLVVCWLIVIISKKKKKKS